jgi:hypothetical protein
VYNYPPKRDREVIDIFQYPSSILSLDGTILI